MTQIERPTLSVAETANLLGISRWLVQQAVHDGSLPSARVGRRILIPRSRLLAWLDGMEASAIVAPATVPEYAPPRPRIRLTASSQQPANQPDTEGAGNTGR
jgi:excisionase family DNA binding protein